MVSPHHHLRDSPVTLTTQVSARRLGLYKKKLEGDPWATLKRAIYHDSDHSKSPKGRWHGHLDLAHLCLADRSRDRRSHRIISGKSSSDWRGECQDNSLKLQLSRQPPSRRSHTCWHCSSFGTPHFLLIHINHRIHLDCQRHVLWRNAQTRISYGSSGDLVPTSRIWGAGFIFWPTKTDASRERTAFMPAWDTRLRSPGDSKVGNQILLLWFLEMCEYWTCLVDTSSKRWSDPCPPRYRWWGLWVLWKMEM